MFATCTNGSCTQQGVRCEGEVYLLPSEVVICGSCGEPCEVAGPRGDAPEPVVRWPDR